MMETIEVAITLFECKKKTNVFVSTVIYLLLMHLQYFGTLCEERQYNIIYKHNKDSHSHSYTELLPPCVKIGYITLLINRVKRIILIHMRYFYLPVRRAHT